MRRKWFSEFLHLLHFYMHMQKCLSPAVNLLCSPWQTPPITEKIGGFFTMHFCQFWLRDLGTGTSVGTGQNAMQISVVVWVHVS